MKAFITLINTTKVPAVWILSVIGISLFLLVSADIIHLECDCCGDNREDILKDIKFCLIPAIVLTIAPCVITMLGIQWNASVRIVSILSWYMRILGTLIIIRGIYWCLTVRDD